MPQGQKILHFVSDFRDLDWSGPGAEELSKAVDKLVDSGIHLSLIDTAHPYRGATRQVALHHDNLAITDLHAEARVVAEGVETEFSVTIRNYSSSDKKTFLHVKVDGKEAFAGSRPIERIPADGQRDREVHAHLRQEEAVAAKSRPSDLPEDRERKHRLDQEFVQVTAEIGTGGNRPASRQRPRHGRRGPQARADARRGRQRTGTRTRRRRLVASPTAAYEAARSYEIERCKVDDLDKINLELYPTVIFLNVAEIKSDKTLKKVQEYVQHGGSLCYFLGDKVRPTFYNDTLFKKFNGLFPLLIETKSFDPLNADGRLTPEERDEKAKERRFFDEQPKLLFRDSKHEAVRTLADYRTGLRYSSIDRYFQALPRSRWDPNPSAASVPRSWSSCPTTRRPTIPATEATRSSWAASWSSKRATSPSPSQRPSPATSRRRSAIRRCSATP